MNNTISSSPKRGTNYKVISIIILVIVAIAFFSYLVYRASTGVSSTLDTLLITIIGIGASVAASIIIGRWSAQKTVYENLRPFLRTAFRSHGELILGLGRVAEEIQDASDKLSDRVPLLATKARVQEQYQRALEGLENWKELLPEGIQELVEKIRQKREEEEKIHEAISEISAVPFSREMQKQLEQLKKEKERISEISPSTFGIQGGEAKRLVLNGAYVEAIGAYSRLLKDNPRNYTLYLGRARARYLAGDKDGALKDLDEVDHLKPGELYTSRLRDLISKDRPLLPVSKPSDAHKEAYEGNTLLAAGDGDGALDAYKRAAGVGLLEVYTFQNNAMAFLVKGDHEAAREQIERIDPKLAGPYIKVQHFTLLALCSILEKNTCEEEIESLKEAITMCSDFNLNHSPLNYLEQGLQAKKLYTPAIENIFHLLTKGTAE